MVIFHEDLYVSEKLKKKESKLRRSLRLRRGLFGVYIIALCDGNDQVEIFDAMVLKQPHFRKATVRIIGLSDSAQDATDYVVSLVEKQVSNCGNADIKSMLMKGF